MIITVEPGEMTPAQMLQPAMRYTDLKINGRSATPQQFLNWVEGDPINDPRPNMVAMAPPIPYRPFMTLLTMVREILHRG